MTLLSRYINRVNLYCKNRNFTAHHYYLKHILNSNIIQKYSCFSFDECFNATLFKLWIL